MKSKRLKSIKVAFTVQGEGTWMPLMIGSMNVDIEDNGSFTDLMRQVDEAMVAIRSHLDSMQMIRSEEIITRWKDFSAYAVGKSDESENAKVREQDNISLQNRVNAAENEVVCLKNQVNQLINQLSKNIESERVAGEL